MTQPQTTGMVQTVQGLVSPKNLGITLPHEHILSKPSPPVSPSSLARKRGTKADAPVQTRPSIFVEPVFVQPGDSAQALAYQPVSLENLWWVRSNPNSSIDNLRHDDEENAIREVMMFKALGGSSIVEMSGKGLGRHPLGLLRISQRTGLNIVMGTAYYIEASHPPDMGERTDEDIADEFVQDIVEGVDGTGIKAGVIGEMGCSWPWTKNEQKAMRGAGIAQRRTGAPLSIHPGRHRTAPFAIVETLREVGADLSKTVMGHVDRTLFTYKEHKRLAETGVYVEFDLFGTEYSYYAPAPWVDMPNDGQRINHVKRLIDEGYGSQVLLSHDAGEKIRLTRWGGGGYGHILRNIVPRMKAKGITEEQIHLLLVENPARVFQFGKPG